jgi:hypothetical protein
LTVRTEVTVDECLDRRRQLMPDEIETAHNFQRDILRGILRPMFGGVNATTRTGSLLPQVEGRGLRT